MVQLIHNPDGSTSHRSDCPINNPNCHKFKTPIKQNLLLVLSRFVSSLVFILVLFGFYKFFTWDCFMVDWTKIGIKWLIIIALCLAAVYVIIPTIGWLFRFLYWSFINSFKPNQPFPKFNFSVWINVFENW